MPTYSYRCKACDNAFDIVQTFTDATLTECPACGGALRKVFSPVGISFTGSGFYRNDSRPKPASESGSGSGASKSDSAKDSSKKDSGKKEPAKAESATSASAKTESKPARNPA